jgi:hypothetical protein
VTILIRTSLRFELPSNPAKNGWAISPRAFSTALDDLVLRRFVHVRYSAGRECVGSHRVTLPGEHLITLSQRETVEEASKTLWHELAHALQAENYELRGGRFHKFYTEEYKFAKGGRGASYRNNAYEIKARFMEERSPYDLIFPAFT